MRENTISSLKNAYSHGADMVEFDVHLSKDKIPVIYHDFELCTTSLSKDGQQGELIPMQLKNLTLKQLRGLKIHHVNAIDNGVKVNVCFLCCHTAIKVLRDSKKNSIIVYLKFFDSKFSTNGLWVTLITKMNFKAFISLEKYVTMKMQWFSKLESDS